MSSRLPDFVDPWRLANLGKTFSGSVELGEFPRLTALLVTAEGEARFTLEFYRDEKKRARVRGTAEAGLTLECQRCLEQMTLPVDSRIDLAVIEVHAEAELLPDECDPVVAEEGRIQLYDLIEDELLLAIPQVPMHPLGECPVKLETQFGDSDEMELQTHDETEEANPFAILAGFKPDKQN